MGDKKSKKKSKPDSKKGISNGGKIGISKRRFMLSTLILLLAFGIYKLFEAVTVIPDLPATDPDAWWGDEALKTTQDTSIRPYKILYPEAILEDMYDKMETYTRRQYSENAPKSFEGTGWRYGVNFEALDVVVREMKYRYNFRTREKFLNQYDHFLTNIQGIDIHFVHVKPKVDKNVKVLPIILLHGWPSTFRDFYEMVPALTTVQPGYDFVFELVIPSLPGFAYSQAAVKPGLGPRNTAVVMNNLMQRLGFAKYYIHGGDFGQLIGSHMATLYPENVLGYHTNFGITYSKMSVVTWILGAVWPPFIEGNFTNRMYPLSEKLAYFAEEFGYMHLQGSKPDTIGIALQDSPVGLAAYILDRQMIFTDLSNRDKPDGGISTLNLEKFIDNIALFYISGSITSSMRMYAESFADYENQQIMSRIPTPVPTWIVRFKHETVHFPDFVLRWKYPNLIGSSNYDQFGGHFAPFERPNELVKDLYLAVSNFISYHEKSKKK